MVSAGIALRFLLSAPRLNLLMLRVADLERAANFYRQLGLEFVKHSHGSGPEHYASETANFVFELYPASIEQPVANSTRLGFEVTDIEALVTRFAEAGHAILSPPRDSEWGPRAVVIDPDGHRIELLEKSLGIC